MARVALALMRGTTAPAPRDREGERAPRGHVFDERFSPVYDEGILAEEPRWLRPLLALLPTSLRMALAVQRRSGEYDAVVTWGEKLSLALAAVQWIAGGKPHVAMMYWFSKTNVRIPLRLFGRSIHAFVTWSSVQREWAMRHLGVTPERIPLVKHFVDQTFWRPLEREEDRICSAGSEMRDYATLAEALRGSGLRCHVASEKVRVNGAGLRRRLRSVAEIMRSAGPGVTSGGLAPLELRELYARSRFVVLPLHPTDTDNGVSVMLEAMAMGKPVICSRTEGQVDVLEDGVTGMYVPVGDPSALREAMLALWNDPDRARRMGALARERALAHHTIEKFACDVREAAEGSLAYTPLRSGLGRIPVRGP